MHLVRLVCLGASSAIKVRFGLVRVGVSYVILRKNNRCTRATSVAFRAGIVRF